MKKFEIDYKITYTGRVTIEAESQEEAERMLEEMYNEPCGDMPVEGEFGTLPCEVYGMDIESIFEE